MNTGKIVSIIHQLRSISWAWDYDGWLSIAAALNLTVRARVGSRVTYQFIDNMLVDVFWSSNRDGDHVDLIEIVIDAFFNPQFLSDIEYRAKVDKYCRKFQDAVVAVSSELGPPAFCGTPSADEFPDDQEAIQLALWNIDNARLMIQEKHEDKELPFRICIVIAPP